jgi:hypothetical protein
MADGLFFDVTPYALIAAGGSPESSCVRTVSHTPENPGQTRRLTGTCRCTSLLREGVDRKCVGEIWCASARANGINFQACLIDRSSISPFRIKHLRTVWDSLAQNAPSNPRRPLCDLESSVYGPADRRRRGILCQTCECRSLTYGDADLPADGSDPSRLPQLVRAARRLNAAVC